MLLEAIFTMCIHRRG